MSFKQLLTVAASAMLVLISSGVAAQQREYIVGSGATYRPFEFETKDKEIVGFDIDLIKAIAEAGHFKVKVVNTPWEGIFATLDTGDRDILMSGITITDKRKEIVDFSAPYFVAYQSVALNKDSKAATLKDLKGVNIGVVNSSAGDTAASEEFGKNSPTIKRFDSTPLMLEELFQGGVGAAIGDVGVLQFYTNSHPNKNFKVMRDPRFKDQYLGMAVKKGNKELLTKLNGGLKTVIANGTYNKIHRKWFGSDAPALPAQ